MAHFAILQVTTEFVYGSLDIINFYKNCKSLSSSKDGCTTTDDNMHHTTTCECSSNLCNGVENSHNVEIKQGCFLFSVLTLLLW